MDESSLKENEANKEYRNCCFTCIFHSLIGRGMDKVNQFQSDTTRSFPTVLYSNSTVGSRAKQKLSLGLCILLTLNLD